MLIFALHVLSSKIYTTAQHGNVEICGGNGYVRECRVQMLKKINEIGFLYRGLSVELLAVLIADLDGRLLIVFGLWSGSVVEIRILNFDLVSQGLFSFSWFGFFC